MTRGKRTNERERITAEQQLTLGVPTNMSVEGARKMDTLVAYLYRFRAATLEQLTRCLPGETEGRVAYWLTRYPYIRKQMVSLKRYDAGRREWIQPRKIGVYTLPSKTLLRYEIANEYNIGEQGYTNGHEVKIEHKPKKIENALYVIELFTRVMEVARETSMEWIPNQFASNDLKEASLLGLDERLSTSGFIRVDSNDSMWGIGVYVNQTKAVVNTTKMMFPSHFYNEFDAIMLVRNEHLGRVHELAFKNYRPKGVSKDLYFRFIPYEFSVEHPKWFLGILQGNRWSVLKALIENMKAKGDEIEFTMYHSFHFRVIHADGQVEYIDTSYGAELTKVIELLTHKATEKARYTLYVADESEMKAYKAIVNTETLNIVAELPQWIEFRLIDWPGGK